MNFFKMIADELEVELYKPFKARMLTTRIYLMKITEKALYIYLDGNWEEATTIIYKNFLNGTIEIIKEQR